jgi:hypothetical protein
MSQIILKAGQPTIISLNLKWFYIWYVALAWWLVPCLPFPGLPHIYFLFTVRLRIFHVFTAFSGNECWDIYKFDTNERVGVFLAWRSVQHLVFLSKFQIHVYDCWRLNLSPCLLHWV